MGQDGTQSNLCANLGEYLRAYPYREGCVESSTFKKREMSLDPRVRFGLKLVEIRKTKGWSQERLALESGLARSYLGGVERGQRNIALLNIFKLAEALEVEPAALFVDR